jgi:hypothetical protein
VVSSDTPITALAQIPYLDAIMDAAMDKAMNQDTKTIGPEFEKLMKVIAHGTIYVTVGLGILWGALTIAGALLRWRWVFWVQVIFGVFALIGIPMQIAALADATNPLPLPLRLWQLVVMLATASLWVVMLLALVKLGPWAMKKTPAIPASSSSAPA